MTAVLRACMRQTADSPEDAALQDRMLQIIAFRLNVGNEQAPEFRGQVCILSHGFGHRLRATPTNSTGLVVQLPDKAAHDNPGRFQFGFGQVRCDPAQGRNGMPFYPVIDAAQKREKRIDNPSGRQPADFVESLFKVFNLKKLRDPFF